MALGSWGAAGEVRKMVTLPAASLAAPRLLLGLWMTLHLVVLSLLMVVDNLMMALVYSSIHTELTGAVLMDRQCLDVLRRYRPFRLSALRLFLATTFLLSLLNTSCLQAARRLPQCLASLKVVTVVAWLVDWLVDWSVDRVVRVVDRVADRWEVYHK